MRLRNIPASRGAIEQSEYVVKEPGTYQGKWHDEFPDGMQNAPIMLEIGMGKGRFLLDISEKNPENIYIGMEYQSSVLYRALQKLEKSPRNNVLLMREDAVRLCEFFDEGELDGIYLNFSDPWPKERHEKRRLTSGNFLSIYKKVLKPGGFVEFKTDNRALFDFSVASVNSDGWEITELSYDLHGNERLSRNNILTEYEEKFSAEGHPICNLVAKRP